MNLDKQLTHIKTRKPYVKSFITEDEEKVIKDKFGKVDTSQLERETVGNVMINCLAFQPAENKKDGFYANAIAQIILGEDRNIEFQEKFKDYLKRVLENSIVMSVKKDGKDELKGLYSGWVIAQVLEELGYKEE